MGIAKELNAEDIDKKPITIIGDDPRVDILKAAHSINYDAARKSRLTTTVHGTTVPYISLQDLIRSKTGTNRPKDQQDILEVMRALRRTERQSSERQEQSTRPEEDPTGQTKGETTKAVVRGHDREVGGKARTSSYKKGSTRYRS